MACFKDYAKILRKLDEMEKDGQYVIFEEAENFEKKVSEKFVSPLCDAGNEEWCEIEDLFSEYSTAYLCTGFINGFICAMHLMYKEAYEEAKSV